MYTFVALLQKGEEDLTLDSEDDYRSGSQNISRHQQESFKRLLSPGRSHKTNTLLLLLLLLLLLRCIIIQNHLLWVQTLPQDWMIQSFKRRQPWCKEVHCHLKLFHRYAWLQFVFMLLLLLSPSVSFFLRMLLEIFGSFCGLHKLKQYTGEQWSSS